MPIGPKGNDMAGDELELCPFERETCDHDALRVCIEDDTQGRPDVFHGYVVCDDCGARGPEAWADEEGIRSQAIFGWNDRARLSRSTSTDAVADGELKLGANGALEPLIADPSLQGGAEPDEAIAALLDEADEMASELVYLGNQKDSQDHSDWGNMMSRLVEALRTHSLGETGGPRLLPPRERPPLKFEHVGEAGSTETGVPTAYSFELAGYRYSDGREQPWTGFGVPQLSFTAPSHPIFQFGGLSDEHPNEQ